MRYGWMTDIHLEFLPDHEAISFVEEVAGQKFDGLFLTGDISTAERLEFHLRLFGERCRTPVYFVLGNHDYYGGSIETVRKMADSFAYDRGRTAAYERGGTANSASFLQWLPASRVVELSNDTCLVGHGSWADGRLGDYAQSRVLLKDYLKIKNFVQAGSLGRLALLNSLGDQAAEHFKAILPGALAKYKRMIVLTHVPPFKDACWHEGAVSADDWLPHFSCKAVGDVLEEIMLEHPDRQMTVLCGHTHSSGQVHILPNLLVKTAGAEYGSPVIQEITV